MRSMAIIAIVAVIGFVVVACDNGDKPCSHTWGEWSVTTPATCVVTGTGTRNCTACGEADTNTTIPVDGSNHHLVIKTATATCTEGGDVTWKCDRDGCVHEETETGRAKLGHDFVNYITTKEASCIEAGIKKATCERCSETDEEGIPKNDHHNWEMLSGTPSTCTTNGKGKEKCKLCGKEEEGDSLPLDIYNHVFNGNKWKETTAPTCTTAATETEKCNYDSCSAQNTTNTRTGKGIVATAHDWGNWSPTVSATCGSAGKRTRTCNYNSGHTETGDNPSAPATGIHSYQWQSATPATWCTDGNHGTGTENYECTVCEATNGTRSIPCLGTQTLTYTAVTGGYQLNKNDSVNNALITVCIPDYYQGQPVLNMASRAFHPGTYGITPNTNLTSARIGSNMTSFSFQYCSNLASVTIADGITSISPSAFDRCTGLTSITIPDSVTSISSNAFSLCSELTSITIPNNVTSIGYSAFAGAGLTSITIPSSVTSISELMFYSCYGLTSITIPASVTSIGNQAFYDCSNLATVTIKRFTAPSTITTLGTMVFNNTHADLVIKVPAAGVAVYKAATNWSDFASRIVAE